MIRHGEEGRRRRACGICGRAPVRCRPRSGRSRGYLGTIEPPAGGEGGRAGAELERGLRRRGGDRDAAVGSRPRSPSARSPSGGQPRGTAGKLAHLAGARGRRRGRAELELAPHPPDPLDRGRHPTGSDAPALRPGAGRAWYASGLADGSLHAGVTDYETALRGLPHPGGALGAVGRLFPRHRRRAHRLSPPSADRLPGRATAADPRRRLSRRAGRALFRRAACSATTRCSARRRRAPSRSTGTTSRRTRADAARAGLRRPSCGAAASAPASASRSTAPTAGSGTAASASAPGCGGWRRSVLAPSSGCASSATCATATCSGATSARRRRCPAARPRCWPGSPAARATRRSARSSASPRTPSIAHLRRIYLKLGVFDRISAAMRGIGVGLIRAEG